MFSLEKFRVYALSAGFLAVSLILQACGGGGAPATGLPSGVTLDAIGNKTVSPGGALSFNISASNPDSRNISFSTSTSSDIYTARSALFTASVPSAQFNWSPTVADNGTYQVTFTVTNLDAEPVETNEETITISVQDTTIAQGESLYVQHCQSCHGVGGFGGSQSLVIGSAPLYVRTALGLTGNGLVGQMAGIPGNMNDPDADATAIGFYLCNLVQTIDYTDPAQCPL